MESFATNKSRFASYGVVNSLPGEIIDAVWVVIDLNLKGVFPLESLLTFDLVNNNGKLSFHFAQESHDVEIVIDFPFDYSPAFPNTIHALDDGLKETILLPAEIQNKI